MGETKQPTVARTGSVETRAHELAPGWRALDLPALKQDEGAVVRSNGSATVLDLGDGCACFEVHTKMNVLDRKAIGLVPEALRAVAEGFDALVIGNDAKHFGAGADLRMFLSAAENSDWQAIERVIRNLQAALQGFRYVPVPVVAAPYGYVLGGAAELAMAADCCHAHAAVHIGLVEAGVGLIPAGGGCLRMVERFTGGLEGVAGADRLALLQTPALAIAMGKVSENAQQAKQMRYLRSADGICSEREGLLPQAKQRALSLAKAGYRPDQPPRFRAAGADAAAGLVSRVRGMVEGGWASEHDALIGGKLAHVLCGGHVAAGTSLTEQQYLDLEVEAFLALCGEAKTQDRVRHLLTHNKPLRN